MKIMRLAALLLAAVVILCSCGANQLPNTTALSAEQVVAVLLDKVSFSAEMSTHAADYTTVLYGIENSTDAASASAAGTVAEMAAVFYLPDNAAASAAKEQLQLYLNDTISEYKKYAPEEVVKLNKAILTTYGTAVVLCVAPNYTAAGTVLGDIFSGKYDSETTQSTTTTTTTVTTASTTATTTSSTTSTTTATTTESATDAVQSGGTSLKNDTAHTGPYPLIEETGDYESYGGVVRSGNACYECYFYSEKYVTSYTDYINAFARKIPETVRVYSMVVPNSAAITLPDTLYKKIPSADQQEAIEKTYAKLSDRITPIRLYETLMQHRSEYVYFRTDHHWTALGAYYAYDLFCKASGRTAAAIEEYKTASFDNFLGSFYQQSNEAPKLKETPDTVTAYFPLSGSAVKLKYRTSTNGEDKSWPVIKDVSDYRASRKYNAFAAGDNPITTITNSALTDGSVCIFIKDSYGNALIPFLADQYQTIYEIDFRYYENSIYDLVNANPTADVIFVNNISMLQSKTLQGKFSVFMENEPKTK